MEHKVANGNDKMFPQSLINQTQDGAVTAPPDLSSVVFITP